jgi:hypothetical protein
MGWMWLSTITYIVGYVLYFSAQNWTSNNVGFMFIITCAYTTPNCL